VQTALLILLFIAGYTGRRLGWLTPAHGGRMLNLVMSVGLPALFLAEVSRMPLNREALTLPGIACGIIGATFLLALLIARVLHLPRATMGSFVICSMAMNNAVLYPFVIASWGGEGFARLALVDLGNSIMLCTLVYAFAAACGGHGAGPGAIARRLAGFPPLWALSAALLMNVTGLRWPAPVVTTLGFVGRSILLLVILALGILLEPQLLRSRLVLGAVAMRVLLGLALGWLAVQLLDLHGLTRQVVLLGAAAPIGFNATVIANRESLDRGLAASAASLAVLCALVYVPLALWLL
jgi:predicted permease